MMCTAMHHDRNRRAFTLIHPRKLPAIAASALLVLPLAGLLALRRDVAIWMGEPVWIIAATALAAGFALAAIRLFNPEPLMRISPDGIELPKILATSIRWPDIAKIQATTRRGTTGDIHDRLLIHFKNPQIVEWQSSKLRRLFGDTPQAAIAVDIGMIWPHRADDVKTTIHDAARMYAEQPMLASDTVAPRRLHPKLANAAVVAFAALVPIGVLLADLGMPRQYSQGLAYYRSGDVGTALPYLENDARAGDSESAYALASLYLNGDGVTRNPAMAAGWFRRAADAGHAEAAYNLGNAYRLGLGTPKNMEQALGWYRRAADRGSLIAAFTLGKIYRLGDGVRRDYRQAIAWLNLAADGGYPPAEHDLGQLYQEGIAVPRDLAAAEAWYSRAAARGHAPAMYDLARLLLDGDSKQRSVGLASLSAAADRGYAPAQRRLAAISFNGQGLPRDPVAAYMWISLAERSWPAASRADLVREKARITATLSEDDLALAKSQIRAWRPVKVN